MTKTPPRHFAALKDRQRDIRAGFPPDFGLRIHRMISWIGRAEAEAEDGDPAAAFVFYWIAFNAAYSDGADLDAPAGERQRFAGFFAGLLDCDADHLIHRALWTDGAAPVRALVDSPFLFSPFWTHQHGGGAADWESRFDKARTVFETALADDDTATALSVLFDRLYMLRNQLMHGGATWGSSVNTAQLESGARLLGAILPAVATVMMDHPAHDWGRPFFPVVGDMSGRSR